MADEEQKIGTVVLMSNKPPEGGHHSSGWKVALADLMTSLFASFMVLWLMASTTPEGRAEIASVFKYPSITPRELGRTENRDIKESTGTAASLIKKSGGRNSSKLRQKAKNKAKDDRHRPMQEVHSSLVAKLKKKLGNHVSITYKDNEVVITIKGDTLYKPGSYQAQPKDEEIIMDIADVLVDTDQIIRIEGHTDNAPTYNEFVESNFELSALRSARLAWIFNVVGVEGSRIVPKGLGHNFPVASNKDAKGRAKNRRVVITINDDSIFDEITRSTILGTPLTKDND